MRSVVSGRPRNSASTGPTGRRNLRELNLPEERIEVADLPWKGSVPRTGTEDTCKLMWRPGGFVRLVVARVKYRRSARRCHVAPSWPILANGCRQDLRAPWSRAS
jgi:hypothetical protein